MAHDFENIFVYQRDTFPSPPILNRHIPIHYKLCQIESIVLDHGININFMKDLIECNLYNPVVFVPNRADNLNKGSIDSKNLFETVTYNTGQRNLIHNYYFSVVPPMCDCDAQFKIGGVIPLQTVPYENFKAELNLFLKWVKSINIMKEECNYDEPTFQEMFNEAEKKIKSNTLVQQMLNQILLDDGCTKSKLYILYDIVSQNWMESYYNNENVNLPDQLLTSLRALNDTKEDFEKALNERKHFPDKVSKMMKERVLTILKLPDMFEQVCSYYKPIEIPKSGRVVKTFGTQFVVQPRGKMIVQLL